MRDDHCIDIEDHFALARDIAVNGHIVRRVSKDEIDPLIAEERIVNRPITRITANQPVPTKLPDITNAGYCHHIRET